MNDQFKRALAIGSMLATLGSFAAPAQSRGTPGAFGAPKGRRIPFGGNPAGSKLARRCARGVRIRGY